MNTALANNQGELVMPVIVTGTFQHPQVASDVQQLAQMKLQNLLPTSKNPGALTNGILGILGKNQSTSGDNAKDGGISGILGVPGGKKQRPNQQQQSNPEAGSMDQQQQQPNPLGDVLNQVLNKKKKQQQQQQARPLKPMRKMLQECDACLAGPNFPNRRENLIGEIWNVLECQLFEWRAGERRFEWAVSYQETGRSKTQPGGASNDKKAEDRLHCDSAAAQCGCSV